MPCRCDYMEEDNHPKYVTEEDHNKTVKRYKKEIDKLTQDLCFITKELDNADLLYKYASKRIVSWYFDHQNRDEKRVRPLMENAFANNPQWSDNPERVANDFITKAKKEHPVTKSHEKWFLDMAIESAQIGKRILQDKKLKKEAWDKLSPAERKALRLGEYK